MTTFAPLNILDLTHDEQKALDGLMAQWSAKRVRNAIRAGFYDMTTSTRSLINSEAPAAVKNRAYVLGWSALAVDKLNRRCNIDGFYDERHDLADLGLPELVRTNRLHSEISQAGQASLKHAVSWLITTQGDTGAGEPAVLMMARDALSGTGIWDRRMRRLRSFLSITDTDDQGDVTGFVMYLPGLNVTCTKRAGAWTVDRRPHSYGVPVDPIRYKPDLGRPFGRSRITRTVMALQMQAVGAMIRADVNGEAYSLARYVVLGATEEAFQSPDGSGMAPWKAAWKAVWMLGDDEDAARIDPRLARADVKQFQGQSPEPQNAHLRMIAQMFSGETGIPVAELGITSDSNPTSAEALQVSRDDLVTEAGQTTDAWTPDISSAMRRGLHMLNGSIPDDLDPSPIWRNPMHVSRAAAADAGSKTIDKMPWLADTSVGLELMGLTPDQARRAMAERQRAQSRATLDRLVSGGTASDS